MQLIQAKRGSIYTPTVLMLIVSVGLSFLGVGLVTPIRALYGRQIGASSMEIGLMTASFLLAGLLASPLIGWLTGHSGYKAVLWVSLLLRALLVLAYIPVRDAVLLIGLRALEGIVSASVLVAARALMNALAPKTRQGEALGLLSAAQTVGLLMGPAVGALLASQTGYTLSFIIASVPLILSALVTMFFLPGEAGHEAASSETIRVRAADVWIPPLLLAYSLQLVSMIANGVLLAIWSLYMLDHGAALPLIGLSYTTYALPMILLALWAGHWSDRHGRYWFFLPGLALLGGIFCIYGLPSLTAWPLILISTVEGAVTGLARSSLDGFLADVMPDHLQGRAQANFSAAGLIGSLFGAVGAGVLYGVAPGLPFLLEGLICLGACVVLLLPGLKQMFRGRYHDVSGGGRAIHLASGPTMADVLELPGTLQDLFIWLMQQGEATLSQVTAHLNLDEVTTRTLLINLVGRGFVQEWTVKSTDQFRYRVRMKARRTRQLPYDLLLS